MKTRIIGSSADVFSEISCEGSRIAPSLFLLKLTTLIATLFFSVLSPLAFVDAQSFTTFRDPQNRFSIKYPNSMTRRPVQNPAVVFFAQMKGNQLPTLTITRHSGSYLPRSARAHTNGIVDSYRDVGFIDAKIIDTTQDSFRHMPKKRHGVLVGYTIDGRKLMAEVTYVSAQREHFIITYVDTAVNFTRNSLIRRNMTNSFTLSRQLLARNRPNSGRYSGALLGSGRDRSFSSNSENRFSTARWFSSGPPMLAPLILVIIVIFGAATLFRSETK